MSRWWPPAGDHARAELLAAQPAGAGVALLDVWRLGVHADLGVVDHRRAAQPHVVVQVGRDGHFGFLRPGGIFRQPDEDLLDLADAAVAHQLAGQAELRFGALLAAKLQDAARAADRVGHQPALGNRQRGRLLQIDVLAGEGGFDGRLRVPVIGVEMQTASMEFVGDNIAEIFD